MTAQEREVLKAAIDAKRRATLGDCGDTATPATYNAGCRCKACRRAEADYRAMRRRAHLGNVSTHNKNGYNNGCRCDQCINAHREYQRIRHARRKAARQPA